MNFPMPMRRFSREWSQILHTWTGVMGKWDISLIRRGSDSILGNYFPLQQQSSIGTNCPGSPCSFHLQIFSSCVRGRLDKVWNNLIGSHSRPCLEQVGLDTSHSPFPLELFHDFAIPCAMILPHCRNENWLLSTAIKGHCYINNDNTVFECSWPVLLIGRWMWMTEVCFSFSTVE